MSLAQEAAAARPRVGVALGSGSARGLAHIGVLRALEEAGYEVAWVAGTSMGALIGGIYAAGGLEALARRFLGFDWADILALLDPVFPRSGLIDGQKVTAFVREHARVSLIEELDVPFRAVATDLGNGAQVAIASGDLIDAIRASIAVPGIFTPMQVDGRVLVDGGLVNPVPVSVARAMGAERVIAVDLNHDIVSQRLPNGRSEAATRPSSQTLARWLDGLHTRLNPALLQLGNRLRREQPPGLFEVLLSSIYIMQARITEAALRHDPPDLLIQPPLGAVRFMAFDRAAEIIETGYRCAQAALARWESAPAATTAQAPAAPRPDVF